MSRVVVITGASRGIGAEIVRKFASCGDSVVINYLNSQKIALNLAKEVERKGAKALLVQADVSTEQGAKDLIDKTISVFGKVDVLVCNAGVASYKLLIDSTEEDILKVINTNLMGVIYTCREASKNMIINGFGKIINITSMWGLVGASNETVYSASKGGVVAFTKALAKEVGLSGINVNAVAPGVILTDMTSHLDNQTLKELAGQTALGKIGTTADVANAVYFLASDEAKYITGQVLGVDGGF